MSAGIDFAPAVLLISPARVSGIQKAWMHAAYSPFPWFHFRNRRDRIYRWGLRGGTSRLKFERDLPDYTTLRTMNRR